MQYSCSENKGADQLRGYREAGLRLCFRICKLLVFSHTGSFLNFQNLIQTYSLENLLGERKKAHQVMLTGKPYLDGDSASSSEEGEDENNKNNLKELVSNIFCLKNNELLTRFGITLAVKKMNCLLGLA